MNSKSLIILFLLATAIFGSGCKNDDNGALDCDNEVVISGFQYSNAESTFFEINNISVNGDILTAEISSSGCSGDSWNLCLIDSGAVMESFPPQRRIRFVLRNDEGCLAYLQKAFTYDISSLQTEGNVVILQVEDYSESVEYSY